MKVVFHQVTPAAQESFRVLELRGPTSACSWHFHPEYQIGLVLRGSGHRIVGDNLSPHVWQFEDSPERPRREVHALVVYFKEDSLGAGFFSRPEAAAIRRLLQRAAVGLAAGGRTRRAAAAILQEMPARAGFDRVLDLLRVLHLLAGSEELRPIASAGFAPRLPDLAGERIRRVTDYVQQHLADELGRDRVAALACLSPGAFSRFFRARTGKTFQDFVTELRIGRACRLLGEVELNVTEVAQMCGFGNAASFNRAFRRVKRINPTEFRRQMQVRN
jgi:AraC-like DNA-binding protein